MLRLRLWLLAGLACLLWPAAATAQGTCNAPPGTAAVEQYCEWVPSADGDRRPAQSRPPVPVPAETVRELGQSPAGQELARALGQDPAAPRRGDRSGERGGAEKLTGAARPGEPSDNPLTAVGAAVAAGPGVSDLFPFALLAVTVIMLGWAWVSYRRRQRSD